MSLKAKLGAMVVACLFATPAWAQEKSAQEIMDDSLSQAIAGEAAARADLKKTLADLADRKARAASVKPPVLNSAITALTAQDREALQADRLFLSKNLKAYGPYAFGHAPFTFTGPQVAKDVYTDLWDDLGTYRTKTVRLSVIGQEEAYAAFRALKDKDPALPRMGYDERSTQAIIVELETKGVLAGAVVMYGKFYIKQDSSETPPLYEKIVQPVVLVREGGSAVPYVLDLDHNNEPVPISRWLATIRGAPNTYTAAVFLASRYDLPTNDHRESATAYTEDFIDSVNWSLRYHCKRRERELHPREDGDYKTACAERSEPLSLIHISEPTRPY